MWNDKLQRIARGEGIISLVKFNICQALQNEKIYSFEQFVTAMFYRSWHLTGLKHRSNGTHEVHYKTLVLWFRVTVILYVFYMRKYTLMYAVNCDRNLFDLYAKW